VKAGLVKRVGTKALVLVMADDGTVAFNTWSLRISTSQRSDCLVKLTLKESRKKSGVGLESRQSCVVDLGKRSI
jgi:hypothetical protein